ncbi:hypothetical protein Trydic_g15465 [Trypoxylus dichotomus]
MGIKDLWTILRPFGARKPLFELQGKTIAIDLSCWVCEAQNISEYTVHPRMYLRNLYFRTCYLLLLGVNPVYVLEGNAPELKYKTIAARNALQFKGKQAKTERTKKCKDRSHFNYTLKLCEEMLNYIGIVCIKGKGEAEAMCAYLDEKKFVDGCVTQDSDSFAYGSKTVYKNFSISQQGLHSANGGSVDEYNIHKLESSTGIGRYKIIALALICGSDYCDGVFGVGKDSVLKLFDGIPDTDILNRLRSWRTNSSYYENLQKHLTAQNICSLCGHIGKLMVHNEDGCKQCNTSVCCKTIGDSRKDRKEFVKNELNIRTKTLHLPNFPDEELINEFLISKETVQDFNMNWKQPNLRKFIEFTTKYLQWETIYAFEKFFPILTRWHLIKYNQRVSYIHKTQDVIIPKYIKKIRNPKGIPSYEIVWSDIQDICKDIIPSEQLEPAKIEKLFSTIEPQYLVEEAYPELAENFKASKKTTSAGKAEGKSDTDLDKSKFGDENDLDLSDILDNILNYDQPEYVKKNMEKIKKAKLESSFFMKLSTDADLFEQTFTNIDSSSSGEDSDSYK